MPSILLLGENVDNSEATSHADLVSKAHSVAGCRPIKNKNPTASYVSKLPTKQRDFYFFAWLVVFAKKTY